MYLHSLYRQLAVPTRAAMEALLMAEETKQGSQELGRIAWLSEGIRLEEKKWESS